MTIIHDHALTARLDHTPSHVSQIKLKKGKMKQYTANGYSLELAYVVGHPTTQELLAASHA